MAQAVSSNLAASNVSDHIIWRKWILRCFAVTLCILFWNITVYNSNEETTDDFDKKVFPQWPTIYI